MSFYGGSLDPRQAVAFDDPTDGLPSEPPGLEAVGASIIFDDGSEAFALSISGEDDHAELFQGGKVYSVSLRIYERFCPYNQCHDIELAIRQYACVKSLHRELQPDRTWAIGREQDVIADGPGCENVESALCWLSTTGPQKMIRHLEERRQPNEEDMEDTPSGYSRWALFDGQPPAPPSWKAHS